jgi:hypothetical protein
MQGLTHISQTLKETDQLLERHLDGYHRVYRHYEPYDPEEWMKLLKDVHRTFGRPSNRWQWSHVITTLTWDEVGGENNWHIIFHFQEESDAILFALKY